MNHRRIPYEAWPKRIADVLVSEGVQTWQQLVALSPTKLLSYKRFGAEALEFVTNELGRHNLEFLGCYQPGQAPPLPAHRANSNPGVYFLSCSVFIKIGCAKNLRKRTADLIQVLPFDSHVMATIAMGSYRDARLREGELHRQFHHLRYRGEWFHDHPDIRQVFP